MNGFREFLEDQFAPMPGVAIKAMFGGLGVFRDGIMIGLVADDTLYLRADDANRAGFEAAGSRPFVYPARGREMEMPYWRAPESLYDDPEAFLSWAEAAFAAALRARGAKKPAKRQADKARNPARR